MYEVNFMRVEHINQHEFTPAVSVTQTRLKIVTFTGIVLTCQRSVLELEMCCIVSVNTWRQLL